MKKNLHKSLDGFGNVHITKNLSPKQRKKRASKAGFASAKVRKANAIRNKKLWEQKEKAYVLSLRIPQLTEEQTRYIAKEWLLKQRMEKTTFKKRQEAARKAAKRSAEVRTLKAKLGTLKKYVRRSVA